MKKLINFRPIVFIAISLLIGILFGRIYEKLNIFSYMIPCCALAVLFAGACFLRKKSERKTTIIVGLVCILFSFFGTFSVNYKYNRLKANELSERNYYIEGEVVSIKIGKDYSYAILDECTYNGTKGPKIKIENIDGLSLFDRVKLYAKVEKVKSVEDGKYSSTYLDGITSKTKFYENLKVDSPSNSVKAKFNRKVYETLNNAMGENTANLSLALITGDTSKIVEEKEWYQTAGISHVFAVSGLHVGLIFGVLKLLLNAIPIKRIHKFFIVSILLLFYAYLCGFTPSVLRATIMCISVYFADSIGEKKDRLNAVAFSFIIIGLISPEQVFTVGLTLSYVACLSIIILSPTINDLLSFRAEVFSNALAVLISAEIGTIPLSIFYFGYFPVVAVISNLLLIPVITLTFYLLWIGLILSFILPTLSTYFLLPTKILLSGITGITKVISKSGLKITYLPTSIKWAYYPLTVLSSETVNVGKKFKSVCLILIAVILATGLVFSLL